MPDTASILVIDDDNNLRRTLSMILTRAGYVVTAASNLAEARQQLQDDAFNLVFLDLKLPDGSGLSLLPELHSQHPHMPVIILSAHDNLGVAIEAVRSGAYDYLPKPVDPPVLLARIKGILSEG